MAIDDAIIGKFQFLPLCLFRVARSARNTSGPCAAPAAFKELAGNDQWKMATPSDGVLKGKWWEIFGDPQLNQLEELVTINNQNVKQAEAQFRQARAPVLRITPTTIPLSDRPIDYAKLMRKKRRQGSGGTSQPFRCPYTASWEPDLWGRVRLSVQNAVDNAQVSAADLENIRLSAAGAACHRLLSAGGSGHAGGGSERYYRRLSEEPATDHQPLQRRSRIAERDITLAQTQLAGAKAQSTDLHIARAEYEHAIAMLTGQSPSSLEIGVSKIAGPPPPIPLGGSLTAFRAAPDIAANERLVAAANANVGYCRSPRTIPR